MAEENLNLSPEDQSDSVQTMMLDEYSKSIYVGHSSIIGRRKDQQDTIVTDDFYSYLENGRAISVLCDGMGGLYGGKQASSLCASIIHNEFHTNPNIESFPAFYKAMAVRTNEQVKEIKSEETGAPAGAGTTLVSVVIDDDKLYWACVGDSHLYIIRGQEIVQVNNDHNFMMLLKEQVKRGEITMEQAEANPKKEALVSYIGAGSVRYIDINNTPFQLYDGDYIVLCSDGLYRSLSDLEIKHVVTAYGTETQLCADKLTELALAKEFRNQDNTSVVVIAFQNQE